MIAAWINKLGGTSMSYVPYVQMTQGIQDTLAGRVQLAILGVGTAQGHIASGALRPAGGDVGAALAGLSRRAGGRGNLSRLRLHGRVGAGRAPRAYQPRILERVNRELDDVLKDPIVVERDEQGAIHQPRRRHHAGEPATTCRRSTRCLGQAGAGDRPARPE